MAVVVSACLLGENCKYTGGNNFDPRIAELLRGREVIPVCPERVLGMPRIPMELVDGKLINRAGEDVDRKVREAVGEILAGLRDRDIEFAVLKSRSPTCGAKQIYDGSFTGRLIHGTGVLARALAEAGIRVVDAEDFSCGQTGSLL